MIRSLEQLVELYLQLGKPTKQTINMNPKVEYIEDMPLGNQVRQDLAKTSRELLCAQAPLVEPLQGRPRRPGREKSGFPFPGLFECDTVPDVL